MESASDCGYALTGTGQAVGMRYASVRRMANKMKEICGDALKHLFSPSIPMALQI